MADKFHENGKYENQGEKTVRNETVRIDLSSILKEMYPKPEPPVYEDRQVEYTVIMKDGKRIGRYDPKKFDITPRKDLTLETITEIVQVQTNLPAFVYQNVHSLGINSIPISCYITPVSCWFNNDKTTHYNDHHTVTSSSYDPDTNLTTVTVRTRRLILPPGITAIYSDKYGMYGQTTCGHTESISEKDISTTTITNTFQVNDDTGEIVGRPNVFLRVR